MAVFVKLGGAHSFFRLLLMRHVMHQETPLPRRMSAKKEKEFEELSLFIEYYSTNCLGIARDNEIHPSVVLSNIVEKVGKSKALQGLKQAINDTIEDTLDLDPERVKELDEALASEGIVILSVLRKRYWSKYKEIIQRKILKNETEYYIANGLLADTASDLTNSERKLLNQLVLEYEQNA
jgi:hypothetical protein